MLFSIGHVNLNRVIVVIIHTNVVAQYVWKNVY